MESLVHGGLGTLFGERHWLDGLQVCGMIWGLEKLNDEVFFLRIVVEQMQLTRIEVQLLPSEAEVAKRCKKPAKSLKESVMVVSKKKKVTCHARDVISFRVSHSCSHCQWPS
jgi:hypothetical protein